MFLKLALRSEYFMPTCGLERSHLHLMDGPPLLQTLTPHRDVPLVVGQTPAFLAQTLRLEAGESPVVRDGHTLPRHGSSVPGRRLEKRWGLGDSCWAQMRHGEKSRRPATRILLLCGE